MISSNSPTSARDFLKSPIGIEGKRFIEMLLDSSTYQEFQLRAVLSGVKEAAETVTEAEFKLLKHGIQTPQPPQAP